MRRREFFGLVGGAVAGWPHAVSAQQRRARPLVGWLGGSSQTAGARNYNAFLQGLKEHGYEDGKTIDVVHRWADGDLTRQPVVAKELVAVSPDVIISAATPAH